MFLLELIGQCYGWRSAFWVVSFLGIFSLITIAIFVPKLTNQETPSFIKEISVLRNPQVLLSLLMTVLGFGGVFVIFTYISPILTDITGFQESVVTIFIWGFAAFGTVPGFQMRVLEKAHSAPNLASALNIGAFNLGGAGGAWLGGIVLDSSLGLQSLAWIAALVTLLGLIVTIWSKALEDNKGR